MQIATSLISVLLVFGTKAECPKYCQCSQTKGVVECQGQDLTSMPTGIPEWTQFLSIEHTSITSIQEHHLKNLAELIVFKCQKHDLLTLGSKLFKNNKKLYNIQLNNNQIDQLGSRMFEGLTLEALDLTSNNLKVFKKDYLAGVKAVKNLRLQSNKLTEVEDDSLTFVTNLTHLYLNYNYLKKAPATKSDKAHMNVEVLDMSGNPIDVLGSNFFGSFPNVRYLYLENVINRTNLAVHKRAFETNIRIQKLDLSNNFMLGIPYDVFEHTSDIQILNMAGNSLSSIPNLDHLGKLQQIDLSENALTTLKATSFKRNVLLKEAKFRNNVIENLDMDLFSNLAFLSLLDLSSNQISTIPASFLSSVGGTLSKFQFFYAGIKWNWLDNNPISCDCAIIPLFQYVSRIPDASFGVTCAYPSKLKGHLLVNVQKDHLSCVVPRITQFFPETSNIHLVLGQILELRCIAESEAQDKIQIEWILPRNRHYKAPVDDTVTQIGRVTTKEDGSLLVYNVQNTDAGVYTCMAYNEHGKSEKSVEVNVTDYINEQDGSDANAMCDICEDHCTKYKISEVKVINIGYESVTIDWVPTELRQAQYYVWYRKFSGEYPNSPESIKSVKVSKTNNYTIGKLSANTDYLVCVQMAGQPCSDLISFTHCADVTTLGANKLGTSIVLIFIGFCIGTLFGICGCITLLFNKKSSNARSNSKQKYKMCNIDDNNFHPKGTAEFLRQASSTNHTQQPNLSSADAEIMFPDIYTGSVRTTRF